MGKELRFLFYKSVIQSKFDYCDIVWGNVGKGFARKLQILQNRTFRTVMGVDWTVSSETVYNTLKVDRLEDRRISSVASFLVLGGGARPRKCTDKKYNLYCASERRERAPKKHIFT